MKTRKVFLVSSIYDKWGGSESIWYEAVPELLKAGFELTVLKRNIDLNHPSFKFLEKKRIKLVELNILLKGFKLLYLITISGFFKRLARLPNYDPVYLKFYLYLKWKKPDFVLINQGINFDGLIFAHICNQISIPYAILAHKAVEFYWPPVSERSVMIEALEKSRHIFFVSNHNQKLTEQQFGRSFPKSSIARYPIKKFSKPVPFPAENEFIDLLCLGRLFLIDKGQDLLLNVLSLEKWKSRKIRITFAGSGPDEEGLKELASYLGIKNVLFKGFMDTTGIWESFHGLILPSRSEGFALVVQEAMAAGRFVIATNAGGNSEIIKEGYNGFMAESTVSSLDEAMERAWNKRHDFKQMGNNAFKSFYSFHPESPVIDFTKKLISLIDD